MLKKYIDGKLVSYIAAIIKNSAVNSKVLFSNIPIIDLSRSWTDKELYDHFGLTEEERLHIDPSYKA